MGLGVGHGEHCLRRWSLSYGFFLFPTRYILLWMLLTPCPQHFFRILAAFGAEIDDPLLGYVIPLSSFTVPCSYDSTSHHTDNSGCPDLCISGPNEPTEAWIALVQRGKCEFVNKVREAQRLGAKAVVVGGEDPDISGFPDTLVNMYSPGTPLSFRR